MPKKITLQSFTAKHRVLGEADEDTARFLDSNKPGKILIINAGPGAHARKKGYDVVVIDDDLATIKAARARAEQVHYEYADFFSFARRNVKNSYDYVIDNGYSNRMKRSQLHRFFREISKVLKYNGKLLTKTLSVNDSYCKEHCPKRHWTYMGEDYVNFFGKKEIVKNLLRYGFVVSTHAEKTIGDQTFHFLQSTQKIVKL